MSTNYVSNFLSGYFHEDWEVEAETDAEVVACFWRSRPSASDVEALAQELVLVAAKHDAEPSEEWLLRVYGCYYQPRADGLSGSDWLRRLSTLLRSSLLTPDSEHQAPRG